MRDLLKMFRRSEAGATLVEYGVALLLAIVLGGGALVTLANQTNSNMNSACDSLTGQGKIDGVDGCGTTAGTDDG